MQSIDAVLDKQRPLPQAAAIGQRPVYRLRPIMRQGTASSIEQTWTRFATLEEARQAVKPMYHDDRVLRVFIVTDGLRSEFVEWVER